jgi:hypothetical protein
MNGKSCTRDNLVILSSVQACAGTNVFLCVMLPKTGTESAPTFVNLTTVIKEDNYWPIM